MKPTTNQGQSHRDPSTELITMEEAARRLHIKRWAFDQLIKQGKVATIHIGHRRLVAVDDLERTIAAHREGGRHAS